MVRTGLGSRGGNDHTGRSPPLAATILSRRRTPVRRRSFARIPQLRRWRLLTEKVAAMVAGIGYGNFKGACAASPDLDPAYNMALHDVWGVFRRLQK